MGTLIPMPNVSVPQMTGRSPSWARRSTVRRYRGSMPAWCTPTPMSRRRLRVFPNAVVKRPSESSALMASRCSFDEMPKLASDWALFSASSWEKWTM